MPDWLKSVAMRSLQYWHFNESLARGDVPDEWRQANVSPVFKKVKKMMLRITDRCRSHVSAAKP